MATIGDVARLAGVSRSTVSSVLTGHKFVSPETRQRVESAIETLHFTVNSRARALATSRTMALGLVLNVAESQFVPTTATYVFSLAEEARRLGYSLTLLTGEDSAAEIHNALASKSADGLVFLEVVEGDARFKEVIGGEVPGVSVGMPTDTDGIDAVDLDYFAAGKMAVDYVWERGSRRVAVVCWPRELYQAGATYAVRFLKGAKAGARDRGIELDIRNSDADPQLVWEDLNAVFADSTKDGLIFHHDGAIPLLPEILHQHWRDGFQVVGLCGAEYAGDQWLPFDTIDTKPLESVRCALDLLVSRVEDEERPFERRLLAPALTLSARRG